MTMAQGNANRRLIGPTLNSLSPDCQVVHPLQPQGNATPPSSYANNAWLISPYRQPNGKVYALVHNEYYGAFTSPPDCSAGRPWEDCWMVSITSAVSTDDGESYPNAAAPPGHLVAALPYPYERDWGRQGYQNPTNIVANPADGYYYALINVISIPQSAPGKFRDQEVGNCVIRSPGLDPPSWRAWDGTSVLDRSSSTRTRRAMTRSPTLRTTSARPCRRPGEAAAELHRPQPDVQHLLQQVPRSWASRRATA